MVINLIAKTLRQLLQPKILVVGAILIGILYIGGFLSFLTIFSGETAIVWQGQNWAYKTSGAASVSAGTDSVSLSASCSNSCSAYMRNDFDLSKYSEVRFLFDGATSAYAGTSASGSGSASITLDGTEVLGVASGAEERGGTNRPSDSDSLRKSATIKRNGDVWELYENEVKYATINNKNPRLDFSVSASGNYGGGSARMTAYATFKSAALTLAPSNVPAAPSMASLISSIKDWIKRLLDAVPFLSIVGTQSAVLGSTQTYQVALTAPLALDTTFADGTYAVRYCNTALVKADGTILTETGFETCTDAYNKAFTVKLPSQSGQYAVIAVMAESKGTYATTTAYGAETSTWTFAPYEVIAKDALDITTKAPIPGASDIPLKPSGNFLTNLLKALFGWLPFFK